ncbi:hypothetical protein C8R48DRAFT_671286 [Suillus tomentosus]|nr:hypothetical protein C8R48DRAFT_671286 [Suillus tomentosus]
MPAARTAFKRCICEECIEKGGLDENGEPKGLPVAERFMATHLQRVRADRATFARAADSRRNNDGADLVASQLSALTIEGTPSVSTVTDNLVRLTLSENILDIHTPVELPVHPELPIFAPPVPVSPLTDEFERLALSDTSIAKSSQEQIDMIGRRTVLQSHNGRWIVKALKLLDNIESRVQWCFRLLSVGSFDIIGHELRLLRKAVNNVNQKADTVISRKNAIMSQIDGLEAQFESRKPFATDSLKPVEFDASKTYHRGYAPILINLQIPSNSE